MVIKVGDNNGGKQLFKKYGLNFNSKLILSEMRLNTNITKSELGILIGISDSENDNNIRYLRNNGFIKHIGENKMDSGSGDFSLIIN